MRRLFACRSQPVAPLHGDVSSEPAKSSISRSGLSKACATAAIHRQFAENCFKQIEGFGEYGFPESHAASFALLVYSSAWIKCHYPDVFLAALLNSQPMGFYATSQLVRDAQDHGVEVRSVDVNCSNWDCTLETRLRRKAVCIRVMLR